MGVSIDFAKLEKLKQLESTLELLQNAESYTHLLSEVKTALARMEATTKRYASVEAADHFLADARRTLDEAKKMSAEMMAQVEKEKRHFVEMQDAAKAKMEQEQSSLANAKSQLKVSQEALEVAMAMFEKDKADHNQTASRMRSELVRKMEEVAAKEVYLNDKLALLEKLKG